MKIAIIGGGYVGLVSGACFAEFGVEVAVYEADPAKRTMLLDGKIPIYEPGLDKLVADNSAAGRLRFPTTLEAGITDAEAIFIAVGTPTRRGDGHADLTYVFAAVEQVVLALDHPAIIVTKSTVPVGTGRKIADLAHRLRPDLKIEVASNPEFLPRGQCDHRFHATGPGSCGCRYRLGARCVAAPIPAPLPHRNPDRFRWVRDCRS